MKKQKYTAIITQEDDMYVSYNPETGVASQGKSIDQALANLSEALQLYLEETEDHDIPATKLALLTTVEV